jgi:hypothetical protein
MSRILSVALLSCFVAGFAVSADLDVCEIQTLGTHLCLAAHSGGDCNRIATNGCAASCCSADASMASGAERLAVRVAMRDGALPRTAHGQRAPAPDTGPPKRLDE